MWRDLFYPSTDNFMENYMTEGNAAKSIAYFSIPLVLSSVFQQLYNLVDSIIVGNYVGEDALAAVGASYSITMVFISIAIDNCNSNFECFSSLYRLDNVGFFITNYENTR